LHGNFGPVGGRRTRDGGRGRLRALRAGYPGACQQRWAGAGAL